jgi:hypothetical protein
MPGVDAGVLRVRRRAAPLLPAARRPAFVRFLAAGFAAPDRPMAVTFGPALPAATRFSSGSGWKWRGLQVWGWCRQIWARAFSTIGNGW